MYSPIILLGMPGCGKTYWGQKIALYYDVPFYDLDQIIVSESGLTIHEIFQEGGEALFRKMENSTLYELSLNPKNEVFVLALGGGTPAYHSNFDIIRKIGKSIYINSGIDRLNENLTKDISNHRPLVAKTNEGERKQYLKKLLEERILFYEQADYMIFENELSLINFETIINDMSL